MTEVTITDAKGKTLTLFEFDGYRTSLFGNSKDYMKNVYRNLHKFKFRDNDIFLASYPKAGCVWTFEIINMLITGQAKAHHCYDKMATMLDARTACALDAIPSPRILNSHLPIDMLPPDLIKTKPKTIYVIRNYKDITVSLYNFITSLQHYNYDGKWEDWLELHLDKQQHLQDYFSYVQQWEDVIQNGDLPIHVVYYEDLKSDTCKEIKRIAEFLGVELSDSLLKEITENSKFDAMKAKYSSDALSTVVFKKGTGFFRKGEVGDWKNWYTKAQNERVNDIIQENMENHKTSIHFGGKYTMA